MSGWLDEEQPLPPDEAQRQLAGVRHLLGRPPHRVLDLGCGIGRVLAPLAADGHALTGIDRDAPRLARCRATLDAAGADATLLEADFHAPLPAGGFDAVLCLGNTLMTITDLPAAAALFERIGAALAPGGLLLVDDIPQRFWPEVAEGNWRNGVTDDGRWQFAWAPDDAVFTIREGDAVDPAAPAPHAGDRLFRLWTAGEIDFLAAGAGLSGAEPRTGEGLLVMRRPES